MPQASQTAFPFDNTYVHLPDRFFAKLDPSPVPKPELLALNEVLAGDLGLNVETLRSVDSVKAFAGNGLFPGSQPLAMAYAGHQFGGWSPQLGDGRALLLGEVVDRDGKHQDIQLKGSGPTPYSRMGDGRAWLGPVMREYIVSEAMAALGVPTTRALAAVTTGESIIREQVLPGAVLTRVSRSLIRVGTFQFFAARKDNEAVKALADYVIDRLYPEISGAENRYAALLEKVIHAQANLVAHWMSLGFIHGVMNTDNVSIAGETIDYGPCAFMDDFHPERVFSSIDQMGRYAYSNQPRIAHWNLVQLAQSLIPRLDKDEKKAVDIAQATIDTFPDIYMNAYQNRMNAKLGLNELREGDAMLTNELLKLMSDAKSDFTLTFRALAKGDESEIKSHLGESNGVSDWLVAWKKRRKTQDLGDVGQQVLMLKTNPAFIPRNHRIEQAIRSGLEGDYEPFHRLNRVLASPYEDQLGEEELMAPPQPKEVVHQTFCGT